MTRQQFVMEHLARCQRCWTCKHWAAKNNDYGACGAAITRPYIEGRMEIITHAEAKCGSHEWVPSKLHAQSVEGMRMWREEYEVAEAV